MGFEAMPFFREGAWNYSHGHYGRYARSFCEDYRARVAELAEAEARLAAELERDGFPHEHRQGRIDAQLQDLHFQAYRAATSCQLFACMALEGFLNLYGVHRLGQAFYQRNIERLGITEKLAVIGACCGQWTVDEQSPVVRDMRALFDQRNRLVHPKTREFDFGSIERYLYVPPAALPVEECMQALARCIDFFCEADASISRDFWFDL